MLKAFRHLPLALLLLLSGTVLCSATPLQFASAPESSSSSASPEERLYQKGIQNLASGDLKGAEKAFRDALAQRADFANAMLGLAEIEFRRDDLEAGGKLIQQALKAEPDNPHAHVSHARYLSQRKQYPETEAALLKAIELDPRLFRARMDLADFYATVVKKPAEAVPAYEAAITVNPDHAGAHYALGVLLAKLDKSARAESMLIRAMQLEPKNPLPPLALARLYGGLGDYAKALDFVDRALVLQPKYVQARLLRADILLAGGDEAAALEQLTELAWENPKRGMFQLRIGMLHQGAGRSDEARQAYLRAIRIDSSLALAYNNLAWMAAEKGTDLSKAEKWAKEAVKLAPQVAPFHDTLGWVYRAQGRLPMAETTLSAAAEMKPPSAEIYYHLGKVCLEQGKKQKAKRSFEQALAINDKFPEADEARRLLQTL
jgi:tetratricopeptide (TPR) repeat protein